MKTMKPKMIAKKARHPATGEAAVFVAGLMPFRGPLDGLYRERSQPHQLSGRFAAAQEHAFLYDD